MKFNFFEIVRIGMLVINAVTAILAGSAAEVPLSIKGKTFILSLTPAAIAALKEEKKLDVQVA